MNKTPEKPNLEPVLAPDVTSADKAPKPSVAGKAAEFGGPSGPEPTRYGDWERNGRASDF